MHPLLDDLPEAVRASIVDRARKRSFSKGEVVFHEGDTGDTIHLLTTGRVSVHTTSTRGEISILNVVGTGGFFGELALLGEPERSATVIALERVETLTLHRDAMSELGPTANGLLLTALAKRVRELSTHLAEALYLPVQKRILRRLLDLCDVYDGVDIPFTQDDIASMAGASRQTTNKVLRQAVADGAIELTRGRIVVRDPDELRRRAR